MQIPEGSPRVTSSPGSLQVVEIRGRDYRPWMVEEYTLLVGRVPSIQFGKPFTYFFYGRMSIFRIPMFINRREALRPFIAGSDALANDMEHSHRIFDAALENALNRSTTRHLPALRHIDRPVINFFVYLADGYAMMRASITVYNGLAPNTPATPVLGRRRMDIDRPVRRFLRVMRLENDAVDVRDDEIVIGVINRRENLGLRRGVAHFPEQQRDVIEVL